MCFHHITATFGKLAQILRSNAVGLAYKEIDGKAPFTWNVLTFIPFHHGVVRVVLGHESNFYCSRRFVLEPHLVP